MREISTEIEIGAPIGDVWRILADVDQWANWSPIINKSSGSAALGSSVNITMMGKEAGQDGPTYSPTITVFEAPNTFRWSAKVMGGFMMTNDKLFELEETSTGTRVVHKELFSGLMAMMAWSKLEAHVPGMLNSMNQALKEKAENGAK